MYCTSQSYKQVGGQNVVVTMAALWIKCTMGVLWMPQRHSSTMLTESNCHSTAPTFTRLNKSTLFPSFSIQKSLKWNIVTASESLMLIYSRGIYTAWALEGSLNQMRTNFTLFQNQLSQLLLAKVILCGMLFSSGDGKFFLFLL